MLINVFEYPSYKYLGTEEFAYFHIPINYAQYPAPLYLCSKLIELSKFDQRKTWYRVRNTTSNQTQAVFEKHNLPKEVQAWLLVNE
jgi:hypothetical protein